ncbi:MAG: HAD family phosphatase [Lachnospiraceae bacterium]|jgi:HAD superfamily hydrolase (TIGR01484 family)|nr:HAD family phosphatase [Lachnospiraceae bacterium]
MWRKKVLDKQESGYYDRFMSRITFNCTEEEIRNAPFADHVIEVTDKEASKAKALLWLCDHLGWKREETAVFGDGGNDVEMLRIFPHSYAPAGASPEARTAASEILPSDREYAVVEKIRELLI